MGQIWGVGGGSGWDLGGSLGRRSGWEMRRKIGSGKIWGWSVQGNTPHCPRWVGMGTGPGLGQRWRRGQGWGWVQGQGQSGGAMCPWVSMEAPGMCRDVSAAAAPEGRPPSLSSVPSCSVPLAVWEGVLEMQLEMAAGLLTASAGQAVGREGPGEELEQRGAMGMAQRSWCSTWLPGHGETGVAQGRAQLHAAQGRCWPGRRQQQRVWPDFDGLGSALMFRLETARLG